VPPPTFNLRGITVKLSELSSADRAAKLLEYYDNASAAFDRGDIDEHPSKVARDWSRLGRGRDAASGELEKSDQPQAGDSALRGPNLGRIAAMSRGLKNYDRLR
jgi:hypothetical protein